MHGQADAVAARTCTRLVWYSVQVLLHTHARIHTEYRHWLPCLATETCPQTGLDAALKPQTARIQDPTVGHAYTLAPTVSAPGIHHTVRAQCGAVRVHAGPAGFAIESASAPAWLAEDCASIHGSLMSQHSVPHRQLEPLIHSVPESAPPAWMLCAGRYQQIAWLTAWRTSHLLRVHVLHCGLTASHKKLKVEYPSVGSAAGRLLHCSSRSNWTRPVTLRYQDPSTLSRACVRVQ